MFWALDLAKSPRVTQITHALSQTRGNHDFVQPDKLWGGASDY